MSTLRVNQITPNTTSQIQIDGAINITGSINGINYDTFTGITATTVVTTPQILSKDLSVLEDINAFVVGPNVKVDSGLEINVGENSNLFILDSLSDANVNTNSGIGPFLSTPQTIDESLSVEDNTNALIIGPNLKVSYGNLIDIGENSNLFVFDPDSYVFSGNTSADCISDIWVQNLNGCDGYLNVTGEVNFSNSVTATTYYGDGSHLTGIAGNTGSSGTSGVNGSSGTSGTSGTSGANGINGISGSSGSAGSSGENGTSGSSGANGTSGSSGTSGTNFNGNTSATTINSLWVENINANGGTITSNGIISAQTFLGNGNSLTFNPVYFTSSNDDSSIIVSASTRQKLSVGTIKRSAYNIDTDVTNSIITISQQGLYKLTFTLNYIFRTGTSLSFFLVQNGQEITYSNKYMDIDNNLTNWAVASYTLNQVYDYMLEIDGGDTIELYVYSSNSCDIYTKPENVGRYPASPAILTSIFRIR